MKPRTLKTKANQKTLDKITVLVDAIADDAYWVESKGGDAEQFLINTAVRVELIEGLIYTRAQK